ERKIVLVGIGRDQVLHAAAREIQEEVFLVEVEQAVVVCDRAVGPGVAHHDRVVAEAFEVDFAGPDGQQADFERAARYEVVLAEGRSAHEDAQRGEDPDDQASCTRTANWYTR